MKKKPSMTKQKKNIQTIRFHRYDVIDEIFDTM